MPAMNSSRVRWDGRKKARGTKGILQSNPKYQRTSFNTDKRDDQSVQEWTEHDDPIPSHYTNNIIQGFGEHADLYKDVLQISPDATPRELRICYFRRGREVLSEAGLRGVEDLSAGNNVSDQAKTRFQAVSMAYEILSKPKWRAMYLKQNLGPYTATSYEVSSSVSQYNRQSVSWNEEVEELLYERQPEEHKIGPVSSKKKKNRKTRIIIEKDEEALDHHLAKLDAEAEPHFATDFLDTLEESLDGLLRLTGGGETTLKACPDTKKTIQQQSSSSVREGQPIEQVARNNEDFLVEKLCPFLGSPTITQPSDPSYAPNQVSPETHVVPLSRSEVNDTVPFRCISPDPFCSDGEEEPFDTISASSSVSSTRRDTNMNAPDDEDIFDGIDEEIVQHNDPSSIPSLCGRPSSPANMSTFSDLSESVVNLRTVTPTFSKPDNTDDRSRVLCTRPQGHSESKNQELFEKGPYLFDDRPDDEFLDDVWCEDVVRSISDCGEDQEEDLKKGSNKSLSEKPNIEDESFIEFFVEYIKSIVCQFDDTETSPAEFNWKDAILGAFLIDDDAVEKLLLIVEKEVKKTPQLNRVDAMEAPTLHVIESARTCT